LNSTLKRIYASLGANVTSQALTILIQLISIPLFLSIWSLEIYGQWLILSAIPTYFALADFGFLAVIINKMTIVSGANKPSNVNILFHTAIKLCFFVNIFALSLSLITANVIDTELLSSLENKSALVLLVWCSVVAMSSRLIDAVYRSQGEFATGLNILNSIRLIEWLSLLGGFFYGQSFFWAALGQFLGRFIGLLIAIIYTRKRHSGITWGVMESSAKEMRDLLKPAISFMSFPIANAISFQGMTIFIGVIFGPAYLAIFNTYRTLSRVVVQCVNVVAKSVGPELSRKYGEQNYSAISVMHSRGRIITTLLAFVACTPLFFFGEEILEIWLNGQIPYSPLLFDGFLIVALLNAVWQMEMVYLTSLNKHMEISAVYLLTSVLMVALLYFTGTKLGEIGPVIILTIFEIIVGLWCFRCVQKLKNLQLGH
jgi:O-antigen/teichoic acid export membrane protein